LNLYPIESGLLDYARTRVSNEIDGREVLQDAHYLSLVHSAECGDTDLMKWGRKMIRKANSYKKSKRKLTAIVDFNNPKYQRLIAYQDPNFQRLQVDMPLPALSATKPALS